MPEISILGSDFVAGNFVLTPQGGDPRRYHLTDNVSWQKGRHGMRFGFEWQYERSAGFLEFVEPASMVLYSPDLVRAFNADPRVPPQARIPLPDSFRTLDDVLRLPLVGFSVGFGDRALPPRYAFDDARHDHLWRAYWQDSWLCINCKEACEALHVEQQRCRPRRRQKYLRYRRNSALLTY